MSLQGRDGRRENSNNYQSNKYEDIPGIGPSCDATVNILVFKK